MTVPAAFKPTDPRVVRSRRAVIEAATELFLSRGFADTTMDDIAAAADVSKRTVYNHYADKQALFREVVLAATGMAATFAEQLPERLAAPDDLAATLREVARDLGGVVLSPEVTRLRRLLIGEAFRFPDLAAEYYRRAPGRVIRALSEAFKRLDGSGALAVPDPRLAAEQFAFMAIGAPLDGAMFDGRDRRPDRRTLRRRADAAVKVFLAAYVPG
jgi:TetR/AcrR family transcriptional repressor of mexJK operon